MDAVKKTNKSNGEQVLREFPAIGRYRVRMMRKGERAPQLDIREYVNSETFEGFTRRGVRLGSRAEVEQLLLALKEVATML